MARFVQHLPPRRQVALLLVTEVSLAAVGAPIWIHLVLAVVIHLALRRFDQLL